VITKGKRRLSDLYEAEDQDPDELKNTRRYDVSMMEAVKVLAAKLINVQAIVVSHHPQPIYNVPTASAQRFCPETKRATLHGRLQQVDNYEYEMPSDFEDEEIDEEMAFTEEDKKKYAGWFDDEEDADGDGFGSEDMLGSDIDEKVGFSCPVEPACMF
jgi:hypothetical protein